MDQVSHQHLGIDSTDTVIELLKVYNREIINLVPKQRLLVMDIKDGWKPLCKFPGQPVPDEPFPRVNEAEAVAKLGRGLMIKFLLIWVGIIGAASVSFWITSRLWST